jgi:hypothetical protein|tara:strand:- start:201 stop:1163 length:963 start_codon:yes stop_codon:yes gene_type:complete
MKILYVRHRGCNLYFLDKVLKHVSSRNIKVKIISLKTFSKLGNTCPEDYTIIYQTYPGEIVKKQWKFPDKMIEKCDLLFLNLKNKNKILFDAHDSGATDGFSRFIPDSAAYKIKDKTLKKKVSQLGKDFFLKIPRIKNTPSENYLNKFNVMLHTSFGVRLFPEIDFEKKRLCKFHYWSTQKNNKLRSVLQKKIEKVKNKYSINTDKLNNYQEKLKDVFCEINVAGNGEICFRHLETLSAGSLLLSQEEIKDFYAIPYVKLIPYEDYIPYNSENIEEQFDFILNNEDRINEIRKSGYIKLMQFYSSKKCADVFEKYLLNLS